MRQRKQPKKLMIQRWSNGDMTKPKKTQEKPLGELIAARYSFYSDEMLIILSGVVESEIDYELYYVKPELQSEFKLLELDDKLGAIHQEIAKRGTIPIEATYGHTGEAPKSTQEWYDDGPMEETFSEFLSKEFTNGFSNDNFKYKEVLI